MRTLERPKPTTAKSAGRGRPRAPRAAGGWLLAALFVVTSLAAASVTVWLVPVYWAAIAALVFLPERKRSPARTIGASSTAEVRFDPPSPAAPAAPPPEPATLAEPNEPSAAEGASTTVKPAKAGRKPRRSAKTQAAAPPAPPTVTWVRVGPGKFVRVESPSDDVPIEPAVELPGEPASTSEAVIPEPPLECDPDPVAHEPSTANTSLDERSRTVEGPASPAHEEPHETIADDARPEPEALRSSEPLVAAEPGGDTDIPQAVETFDAPSAADGPTPAGDDERTEQPTAFDADTPARDLAEPRERVAPVVVPNISGLARGGSRADLRRSPRPRAARRRPLRRQSARRRHGPRSWRRRTRWRTARAPP